MPGFICSQNFSQKSAEKIVKEALIALYGFTSNKPAHYQLDYGDYRLPEICRKEVAEKYIFIIFVVTWRLETGPTSNKQTNYLLDYGE